MKVLMLGWEYPPLISGGLATASEGLSRALAAEGVSIDFVLPWVSGREQAEHMRLFASEGLSVTAGVSSILHTSSVAHYDLTSVVDTVYSAYARPEVRVESRQEVSVRQTAWATRPPAEFMHEHVLSQPFESQLMQEVDRYARNVLQAPNTLQIDLIHAHDWMTFPAGVLLAKSRGVPLVVHVHSLESDRCGDGGNPLINTIEHLGIKAASQIITVSQYTRTHICEQFGVDPQRVTVVHNGVSVESPSVKNQVKDKNKKRVLFLGRVTYQKGPDIFVEVASKVLEHYRDVVFVLAGNGDMLPSIRARVRALGIEEYFEFPGFVTGSQLEEEYSRADVYVMPSVSEPFGITPLEALSRGTPTIISKQSGVSEVLSHVLKVDFWDLRKQADFIINTLLHPEIGNSMMAMSPLEVGRLRWDNAARQVVSTYRNVLRDNSFTKAA